MKKKRRSNILIGLIFGMICCCGILSVSANAGDAYPAFTKEEENYIREHYRIQVALLEGYPLICEYSDENNGYDGIIMDVLDKLSEKTGFQFEFVTIPDNELPWEYTKNNPNVILAPIFKNSLIDYDSEIHILNSIVKSRMIAVNRKIEGIDLNKQFVLVIPENMYGIQVKIQKIFPNARLVLCKSHHDGLDMVNNGEADMTIVNELMGTYMLQSPCYEKLNRISMDMILEDITLAVGSDADPVFTSILNKAIASFDERDIRQIVVDNAVTHTYDMNWQEWLYKYKLMVFLWGAAIIASVIVLYIVIRQKQRDRVAKERRHADIEYQKKLFYQANFDILTGLYNKNYFLEKANALLRGNTDVVYTFFRINLYNFKMFNELYGQDKGDRILKKIADKLREEIGSRGVFGRLYADQFAICYPVDEETLKKSENTNVVFLNFDERDIRIQLKVGVYVNSQHYEDANQLIDYAQIALQHHEKIKNNHFYFYKEEYLNTLLKNQRITNEMEQALQEEQFRVFLQPQFDLMTDQLVGAEALVRWFHPEEGIIPPNEFISVLENNRFISKVDIYVFQKVCEQLAKWKEQGKIIPVSVNLSRVDLQNPDLCRILKELLDRYAIPIQYVHLEITETDYVKNHRNLVHNIEKLQNVGFVIEMDDFGSGYSSLNMLKAVPVDILKLDMKFFDGETQMDKGGSIIEAVVKLAHSLGILVVAEGVETEREANFLRTIHCHVAQGYLYGRPVTVEDFGKLLAKNTIGKKILREGKETEPDHMYWRIEKYNILLRSEKAILFDYDPYSDVVVFTYMEESGKITEKEVGQYSEKLTVASVVQPEDQKRLKEISKEMLQCTEQGTKEIDFQADLFATGSFEWFHAVIYSYCRNKKLSRVIAIIKRR